MPLQRRTTMPANLIRDLLRGGALSIALIASGATTALADPPGYYFQDSWQPKEQELQVPPPARANANKPTAAAKVDNNPCSSSGSSHSAGRQYPAPLRGVAPSGVPD